MCQVANTVLERNFLSVTYTEEENGFRKSGYIREMLLHPFICENESCETHEEIKSNPIHFTNGCAR